MRVEVGGIGYEWVEDWARLPGDESVRRGWAHTGVVVLPDGRVVTGHPGEARLLASPEVPVVEVHGIALDGEALWIADIGRKRRPEDGYANPSGLVRGQVVKVDLDGRVLARLDPPPLPVYETTSYSPTGVAVDAASGDVWVADGYGANLVHRYDRGGQYVASLSGEEGGGAFNCPHAVLVDARRGEGELLIADRANGRVQVYGLGGGFRRVVGADFLNSPTSMALDGERLVVAEFRAARLTLVDRDDRLIGHVGEDPEAPARVGWPNELDERGVPRRTETLRPGRFNKPARGRRRRAWQRLRRGVADRRALRQAVALGGPHRPSAHRWYLVRE